ncbi:V-type ATP synthase subunit E [Vulcanisaeta distributa]|uniref:H+transporting two-sector ATPase E subunit n=1 Tax=Vulcanisaeta distributa (strain DSM 14429 / JCM 11212 / NBRC 100878 / IC-017) TaxID=572478 RepID=E1QTX1_VULDI|nr:V-type ATP synthase subunit E [Vulcanisaeta distributa]ADN49768.1 H+transporting two-sector ATPase E subunit [Vulcanisaeta distributa DSM 14429]
MSEQELTERLINGIITRLENEINEWSNNVRLRAEAELLDGVKAIIDKYSGTLENIDKELNMEREYRLYNEMMREKREKLSILEEAYAEVVRRIKERISSMRGTDDYKKFLKNSILWAMSIIGSRELTITVSKADKDVAEELVSELGLNSTVNTTEEDLLGAIISSADGSIRVDATLDSRLRLMEHQIKTLLAHLAS